MNASPIVLENQIEDLLKFGIRVFWRVPNTTHFPKGYQVAEGR